MEKQKLPNEQTIMILGILSFVACCCTGGVGGLILSGIGLYLAINAEKLYNANPEQYSLGSINTWKIVNIVSLVISSIFVIRLIYVLSTGQFGEMMEIYQDAIEKAQNR